MAATTVAADPRNDVHTVATQVASLFEALHNKLLRHLNAALADVSAPSPDIGRYRAYFVARFLCQNMYRLIIRNDFLPRLLHEAVLARYTAGAPKFIDENSLDSVPMEFAHVFRFGHAMVRPYYVLNNQNLNGEELARMMERLTRLRPWRTPLREDQLVQWSQFFEITGARPNYSRRLAPDTTVGLSTAFGPLDETGTVGLPYRDLLSSACSGAWSVNALSVEIRRRLPEIAKLSPLIADDDYRRTQLRLHLGQYRSITGMTDTDITELADDPPWAFYALFEAAHDTAGRRLGMLGSVIVAETLYKALKKRTLPDFASSADVNYSFDSVSEVVFGNRAVEAKIRSCSPAIKTMPDLIRFLADDFADARSTIPFV